jgi:hypothetical protein
VTFPRSVHASQHSHSRRVPDGQPLQIFQGDGETFGSQPPDMIFTELVLVQGLGSFLSR